MLSLPLPVRIYLCTCAVDLRKSFDGLAQLVREFLGVDPLSGHLFVFRNKRGDRLKLLYWDRDGYWILYRRLEVGVFRFPVGSDPAMPGIVVSAAASTPIVAQLAQAVAAAIGIEGTDGHAFTVQEGFADAITMPSGEAATLYVGRVAPGGVTAPRTWPSMPDLLRAMAKNRARVPYLRAWQVLAGGVNDDSTKAYDAADVAKALRASLGESEPS